MDGAFLVSEAEVCDIFGIEVAGHWQERPADAVSTGTSFALNL